MKLPREIIDKLAASPARRVLQLLAMADAPLHEGELMAEGGPEAAASMDALHGSDMLRSQGGRVRLVPEVASTVRQAMGDPGEALWSVLGKLAERTHAGWPQDPDLLLLRCRVMTRRSQVPAALDLLERCRPARLAVDLGELEQGLRSMAAADPSCAAGALLLLAREQLRRGEVQRARDTLDEAQVASGGSSTDEFRLLRAEALARAGKPGFAVDDLKRASLSSRGGIAGVKLLLAGLSILAGRLQEARRALVALRAETRSSPELEGRRWAALSLSYVFEERFELARASARRARRAYDHPDTAPMEPILWLIDFLTLLRLDQIDAAAAMAAGDQRLHGRDPGPVPKLVTAALAGRQGELSRCLEAAGDSADQLDRRSDRFLQAIIQRYMARAAIELGQLDRAESLIREVAGAAKEAGLAVLEPMCELEFAILASHRGNATEARQRAQRAYELAPKNPYARVEAWILTDAPPPLQAGQHPALVAYANLRAAERALQIRSLDEAVTRAASAVTWYHKAGARQDEARSLVALGEGLSRLGRYDEAFRAIEAARELAAPRALEPVLVASCLVRASIADRRGDLDAYVRDLAEAIRTANRSLIGRALVLACSRAGFIASSATSRASPFSSLVERLGLARPTENIVTVGDRTYLTDGRCEHGADLELDLEMGTVNAGGRTWDLAGQPLLSKLIEALADAGEAGLSSERLFEQVWGGEYHALRHRNTVYGAINRLRRGLGEMTSEGVAISHHDGHYCLKNVTIAIVRAARTPGGAAGRAARRSQVAGGPLPDERQYALRFGLSPAHARWELALIKEQDSDIEVVSRRSWPGVTFG